MRITLDVDLKMLIYYPIYTLRIWNFFYPIQYDDLIKTIHNSSKADVFCELIIWMDILYISMRNCLLVKVLLQMIFMSSANTIFVNFYLFLFFKCNSQRKF